MFEKSRNFVRDNALRASVAVAALVPLVARADADPFTDALTGATTKATLYAGGLVTLSAATVVIMVAMKYVKKIRGAA